MVVTAAGGPCKGIVCTTPVPIDWPEQQVKLVAEDITPTVRDLAYRTIAGTVHQMVVSVPYLAQGEEAKAVVTFEVTRHALLPPESTDGYVRPERPGKDVRPFLAPSPAIESRHARIRALAKELSADKPSAWQVVEAIYDWVRDHVKYRDGALKGAVKALEDGYGDCEELSSLFIAVCRAAGIPARTVWIPGHCYPEFYLEDAEGTGHWFPCQAAGDRSFGGMPEFRPILQKGDNFRDPDRPRERLRYVSEYLIGAGGRPKVKFIREVGGEAVEEPVAGEN